MRRCRFPDQTKPADRQSLAKVPFKISRQGIAFCAGDETIGSARKGPARTIGLVDAYGQSCQGGIWARRIGLPHAWDGVTNEHECR
jgi:hypothetical protein